MSNTKSETTAAINPPHQATPLNYSNFFLSEFYKIFNEKTSLDESISNTFNSLPAPNTYSLCVAIPETYPLTGYVIVF